MNTYQSGELLSLLTIQLSLTNANLLGEPFWLPIIQLSSTNAN